MRIFRLLFCDLKRGFLLLGLLLPMLFPIPSTSIANAPLPEYTIMAELDNAAGVLQVQETLKYTNSTGVTLTTIVLNVTPAYYKAFQLKDARINGKTAYSTLNGVALEIVLSEPLSAGSSLTLALDFQLRVPKQEGRLGMGNGIIALGNWYPVLAVYDNGWDRHQYKEIGDAFTTNVANYDVTLRMTMPATIAHTGILTQKTDLEWKMEARNVRDFAMAISDHYLTRSVEVDGVLVTVYYPKGHEVGGDVFIRAASESLSWFSAKFGKYPYPNLQIAEIWSPNWLGTGQEYPSLIFVGSRSSELGGGMGDYLSYLVVHEVAHQWFYGIVGNDQVKSPWLDEALTTHAGLLFFKDRYPSRYAELWKSRVTDGYNQYKVQKGDKKVDSTIYDFDDELYYFAMVYRKGAIFLDELRVLLGNEAYMRALRKYVESNWFGMATPRKFFDTIQGETLLDITQLSSRYFDNPGISGTRQVSPSPTSVSSGAQTTATARPNPTTPPILENAGKTPTLSAIQTPAITPSSAYIETPIPFVTANASSISTAENRYDSQESPFFRLAFLAIIPLGLIGAWYWWKTRFR